MKTLKKVILLVVAALMLCSCSLQITIGRQAKLSEEKSNPSQERDTVFRDLDKLPLTRF